MSEPELFSGTTAREKPAIAWQVWAIAGVACLVVVAALLLIQPKHRVINPAHPDPYAANLSLTGPHMSVASNMAGSQVIYVDGTLTNHGNKTVTTAIVSTTFANDQGLAPQIDTQPLQIIRTREPYIDAEPLSASPIKPGESKDFRLIYEQVTPNWNQVTPTLQVVAVDFR